MINTKKFAFIVCVKNEEFYKECLFYINRIHIPSGYTVEVVPYYNALSMANGYNVAMGMTDAQYKIYLHQDVYIINTNFLNDILTVFKQDGKVAMIGIIGSERLPSSGIMSHGERIGNLYNYDCENVDFTDYEYRIEDGYSIVEAIDGMLMVTKEDILWREDIFDGWDFYDISQSFEFRKKGYKVVVPNQTKPWCYHDENVKNYRGYNHYRKVFLEEYFGRM